MRVSFDSNILVYAIDARAGARHELAVDLIARAASADCIQTLQSLAEFFSVATRKGKLSPDEARDFVQDWRDVFSVRAANEESLVAAMGAVAEHGLSFWDAMIWATAEQAGCRLLISEDLQDGRVLGGVRFVDPFKEVNRTLIDTALPALPGDLD